MPGLSTVFWNCKGFRIVPIFISLEFKKCKGDFDEDYDVDGGDLFELTKDEKGVTLKRFAGEFGRMDCD